MCQSLVAVFLIYYIMIILIETYRKFEIYFEPETEMFYTVSDYHDTESSKKSYSAVKKWIDDFIKENSAFKPFYMIGAPNSYNEGKMIRIIGIRKDGRFVCEDDEGKKQQVSEYDEKDYIQVKEENAVFINEIKQLKAAKQSLEAKIKTASDKIIKVTLRDLKPEYKL